MLEIKNLSVSVHGKPILDGLNLTVKAGEVAAIMGPNGSGKSTLSYVIAGKPGLRGHLGRDTVRRARTCWIWSRTSARGRGCSSPSSIRSRSRASRP